MSLSTLKKWIELHDAALKIVQDIINDRNKLTFMKPSDWSSTLQNNMSSSQVVLQAHDDEFSNFINLRGIQKLMLECNQSLSRSLVSGDEISVSSATLRSLRDQLQQQLFLEIELTNSLEQNETSDQDALVTVVACFARMPYVNRRTLEQMIACSER